MHQTEEDKSTFNQLLLQLDEAARKIGWSSVTSVGIVVSPVYGYMTFCVGCGDATQKIAHENASDFQCPHVLKWTDDDVSFLSNWATEYRRVVDQLRSDSEYTKPIMVQLCDWLDEYYRRGVSPFKPIWLVVDDVNGGYHAHWRVGEFSSVEIEEPDNGP
jgi:hypothetical protein